VTAKGGASTVHVLILLKFEFYILSILPSTNAACPLAAFSSSMHPW